MHNLISIAMCSYNEELFIKQEIDLYVLLKLIGTLS